MDFSKNLKSFEVIEQKEISDKNSLSTISILDSKNFLNHQVVIGVIVQLDKEETGIKFKIDFKATVCSQDEKYDQKLGRDIVMGRLLSKEDSEFQGSIPNHGIDQIESLTDTFIDVKISKLRNFITSKHQFEKEQAKLKQRHNEALGNLFKEFK